jgi:hypothetical protein
VDATMLIAEFVGRQIDGHKIDAARVHRYIHYAINNGQFTTVARTSSASSTAGDCCPRTH